jgi:splicing factor 1
MVFLKSFAFHPILNNFIQLHHYVFILELSRFKHKMAWRNQGTTGSNNIPLGTKRRFGDDASPSGGNHGDYNQAPSGHGDGYRRGRSPERRKCELRSSFSYLNLTVLEGPEPSNDGAKPARKKRNRWGDATDNKAAGLMGLPTAIRANMTSEQLEAYTLHLRIEEISQKLRIDDVVPADGDRYIRPSYGTSGRITDFKKRSPSPAPQYDNFGRRVNTREYRYRKKLEDERHKLIEKAMKVIPNYHPPQDYRRPTKTQEKVYVPVNDYPEINFSMIANPLTFLTLLTSIPSPSFIAVWHCVLHSNLRVRRLAITNLSTTFCSKLLTIN